MNSWPKVDEYLELVLTSVCNEELKSRLSDITSKQLDFILDENQLDTEFSEPVTHFEITNR